MCISDSLFIFDYNSYCCIQLFKKKTEQIRVNEKNHLYDILKKPKQQRKFKSLAGKLNSWCIRMKNKSVKAKEGQVVGAGGLNWWCTGLTVRLLCTIQQCWAHDIIYWQSVQNCITQRLFSKRVLMTILYPYWFVSYNTFRHQCKLLVDGVQQELTGSLLPSLV